MEKSNRTEGQEEVKQANKERGASIYKILHWKMLQCFHMEIISSCFSLMVGTVQESISVPIPADSKVSITLFLRPQTNINASSPSRVLLPLVIMSGLSSGVRL